MSREKLDSKQYQILPQKKGGSNPGAWCSQDNKKYMVKLEVTNQPSAVIQEVLASQFYSHPPRPGIPNVSAPEVKMEIFNHEFSEQLLTQYFRNANSEEALDWIKELTGLFLTSSGMQEREVAGIASAVVNGFHELGEDKVAEIYATRKLPTTYEYEGQSIPLCGLARAAALAKILGDNDWIGGGGGNLGVIIKEDDEGPYAQVVVVDPGQSFSLVSKEGRTFGISAQGDPEVVIFDQLSDSEKREFLLTIHQFSQYSDDELASILTNLGAFNKKIEEILARSNQPTSLQAFIQSKVAFIRQNIRQECQNYQQDLMQIKRQEAPRDRSLHPRLDSKPPQITGSMGNRFTPNIGAGGGKPLRERELPEERKMGGRGHGKKL